MTLLSEFAATVLRIIASTALALSLDPLPFFFSILIKNISQLVPGSMPTMPRQQCHASYATSAMPHQLCHVSYATPVMPRQLCYVSYATPAMPRQLCHVSYAMPAMLRQLCYASYATPAMPRQLCHASYATPAMLRQLCHYNFSCSPLYVFKRIYILLTIWSPCLYTVF